MPARPHAPVLAGSLPSQAKDRPLIEVRNPATQEFFASYEEILPEELELAVRASLEAFETLKSWPNHRLRTVLHAIADQIEAEADSLAWGIVRSMGKPIQFARGEVTRAQGTFRLAAEASVRKEGQSRTLDLSEAHEGTRCWIERFPVGPVAGITPFNFPLNLAAHKVAPALAVGCPILIKPPRQSPFAALELARFGLEAGLPPGAFQVLPMPDSLAQDLATHPKIRHTSFTGSGPVGWKLKGLCVTQGVTLELGGNAAAIVHRDADLEHALERCLLGAFAASGQVCIKTQRILVHAEVFEEFRDRFVLATQGLKGPDPEDPASVYGPLIDTQAAKRVEAWIQEAVHQGAHLHCGGERTGQVLEPAVLTGVHRGQKLWSEEIFGPVALLEPYAELEEAIRMANDSIYGLQLGLFTKDLDATFQVYRDAEVGGVIVGDSPTFRADAMPYGGIKASGFGREGIQEAMEALTEPKTLVLRGLPR